MSDVHIPGNAVFNGAQPGNEPENDFMRMPNNMSTYVAPQVPEPEDAQALVAALERAENLLAALAQYRVGEPSRMISLDDLDTENRRFFDQLLGEGEVSVRYHSDPAARIQESVLAGVWRAQQFNTANAKADQLISNTIEVADMPALVRKNTFAHARENVSLQDLDIPDTVCNAPPLLAEIHGKLTKWLPGMTPHVINLSLLPHTGEDLDFLSRALGIGPTLILSRGYGNCRISSTNTRNVWWVQYYNSQDVLILNTLEISDVPEVACAAVEDLQESRQRLEEILAMYR